MFLVVCHFLTAQEELKGSLQYADGSAGRVSYIDMAIKGRAGMKMQRAISKAPFRESITITQDDLDYAVRQISMDGTVTHDEENNVIIVISATHRRIITPTGSITEVFEAPEEFASFFFNYTSKYSHVIKAVNAKGEKRPYIAQPLKKGALNRVYVRVAPYEEVCVIEALNYPIKGYVYHEARATASFMKSYPNSAYPEDAKSSGKLLLGNKAVLHPVEDGYFSFMQDVGSSNFNNTLNVYKEQVKEMRSLKDVSEITANEMQSVFDGSLLNAEIIVGKGGALSTQTFDKLKTR